MIVFPQSQHGKMTITDIVILETFALEYQVDWKNPLCHSQKTLNLPSSSDLQQCEAECHTQKNPPLPCVMDKPQNLAHGSNSTVNCRESNMGMPLYPQKKKIYPTAGGSDTNKLPHWLREAVNIPPSRPPELDLLSTLPPTVSAIAHCVRLLYGEERAFPPFVVPSLPPIRPKDPRKSLKKKRRMHGLPQLTPDVRCTMENFDHTAPSTTLPAPALEMMEPVSIPRGTGDYMGTNNLYSQPVFAFHSTF